MPRSRQHLGANWEGMACHLWHPCDRFAITELLPYQVHGAALEDSSEISIGARGISNINFFDGGDLLRGWAMASEGLEALPVCVCVSIQNLHEFKFDQAKYISDQHLQKISLDVLCIPFPAQWKVAVICLDMWQFGGHMPILA